MRGIAGILSFDGDSTVSDRLDLIIRGMPGRGAAEKVSFLSAGSALAQLSPLKSGADSDSRVCTDTQITIVFDGRLDNRAELTAALSPESQAYAGLSDAQLALRAYGRWSEDCPSKLLGEFAFALWDAANQRLFCARDPAGARSLFFVQTPGFLAFASDDEALVHLPEVDAAPCRELIAFFLVKEFGGVAPDQSWLGPVRLLLPGHSMSVKPDGQLTVRPYRRFEPSGPRRFRSDAECREAFREEFARAVTCRLNVAGETGAIISGGMDSAALAATLDRLGPDQGYDAFSVIADDAGSSLETRSILSLTSSERVRSHCLSVPSMIGESSLSDVENAAWRNAHPVDNAILITELMCAAARRHGHSALLHAPSGDLAQGNCPHYVAALLRSGQWCRAWREAEMAASHHTYLGGQSPPRILLRDAWVAWAPAPVKRARYRARTRGLPEPEGLELLNPDLARALGVRDNIARIRAHIRVQSGTAEEFRAAHAESLFGPWSALPAGLEAAQRVGARHGVYLSDPWADLRVLDFFLNLPLDQIVRNGWTKFLARSAFVGEVEDWVLWRSDKEHLGWALKQHLLRASGEWIDHVMHDELERVGECVHLPEARRIFDEYRTRQSDEVTQQVYDLVTLVCWVKRLSEVA